MKNRSIRFVCILLTAILTFVSGIAVNAYTADIDPESITSQIMEYKTDSVGASDLHSFVSGYLTENAGSGETEWYAFCLAKEDKYDFSAYSAALEAAVSAAGLKATDRLRIAIAYHGTGGTSLDIGAIIDDSWSKLGIMSEIYSLILINSGDFQFSADSTEIVKSLLSRQLTDGGWALSGIYSDPDVTSMALQALSAYKSNADVQECIDRALNRLAGMQQSDGGFKSYGTSNSESCAQVIIALCQLGIDPQSDSRFIKNGNTAVDALLSFSCDSGGFSHLLGYPENNIATVQAFEAMTALAGLYSGRGGLYDLKEQYVDISEKTEPTVPVATTEEPTKSGNHGQSSAPSKNYGSGENTGSSGKIDASGGGNQTSGIDDTDVEPPDRENVTSGNSVPHEGSSEVYSATASSEPVVSHTQTTQITSVKDERTDPAERSEAVTVTTASVTTSVRTSSEAGGAPPYSDTGGTGGQGWRVYAYIVISGIFVFCQLYFISRKQFSPKRLIISLGACAVCAGAVSFVKIQSPEEYYSRNIDDIQPDSLTVTLSVSCETIKDEIDGDYMIVPETRYVLLQDDTVFDVLERVLAYEKIPFDYSGSSMNDIYVKGIADIYEMDYGEMSGWMYRVNGEFPDTGCGGFILEDGDCIEWVYTCDIGRDVGMEEYSE